MSNQDTNHDAREFGQHVKHAGWRLGLLVARNVEPSRGQGSRTDTFATEKVSAHAFAVEAGTSTDRVLRYLDAWQRAADAGHVPHAADLKPGDDAALPDTDVLPWDTFYNARATEPSKPAATVFDVAEPLLGLSAALRNVVRQVSAMEGRFDDDGVRMIETALDDIQTALDWLRSLIQSGTPMTDDALHAWLDEPSR